ncbi:type IV secretory system conjugative DNA transfer family protein [Nocardia sp. NPDC050175]|uniref:type IV secretory system conjugative DNA transfer family protein n=1 Tax=Nocardia sp. NPDC050175 TaxID=3364317 RepID=UPI0037B6A555
MTVLVRVLILVVLGVGIVVAGLHIGNARSVVHQSIPANPGTAIADLIGGDLSWPKGATAVVIGEIAIIGLGLFVLRWVRERRSRGRPAVDGKAGLLATGAALESLTAGGARLTAQALGVRLGFEDAPGVAIGTAVADGCRLYGSYEDLHLDIWGPRQGKSTCRAIPAVLDAIGAVITTSTSRDVVDATRGVREAKGSPVFVFDPHGIADEPPTWFWNPLTWVDGDDTRAAQLARHFADADARSDRDDYFEIQGEELLAMLFLAASVDRRPITQVWEWVTNPVDTEPIELLRHHGSGFAASGLAAIYNTDVRHQRGIFGTAMKMARPLRFPNIHPWITPGSDRLEFDELEFIERGGTLYALSVEGRNSAAPLVSAFIETMLDVAARRNTRLMREVSINMPVLAVLDDAANMVRWRDFPQRYSYYGSRGVVLMAMLQSWAQGVRCWGPEGMDELWSAATIKVLGGGIDDGPFLRDRVGGIGSHEVATRSVSVSARGIGYSTSIASANTLGVSELRSLPRGRAVLFAAGVPPVLIKTEPWWEGPYADEARKSIAAHGPRSTRELIELLQPSGIPPKN